MKLLLIVCALFAPYASAIRCGRPLTNECLGATDIRYDPEASNDAEDQAEVWKRADGLFRGEGIVRVNIFNPLNAPIPALPDPSVFEFSFVDFANYTITGSRQIVTSYLIVPDTPLPPRVTQRLAFATTTYEKDGSLISLPSVVAIPGEERPSQTFFDNDVELRSYAVDENTVYLSGEVSGTVRGINSITNVCLDEQCNQMQESFDTFQTINGTVQRVFASETSYTRIATGEEWINAILAEYDTLGINPDERIDPSIDICAAGLCPTEEEWCQTDPNCSESPYQEPPARVKQSVIAGFTVAGILLFTAVLYAIHWYLVAAQAHRYRATFARRIAETIDMRASVRNLTPEALAKEFERIDEGVARDGKISKEELWEFISSGKAGEMKRHDFNALFASMDLDNNGEVDFVEFCAFMARCDEEYRAARRRSSVGLQQPSRLVAHRLSDAVSQLRSIDEPSEEVTGGDEGKEEE